MTEQDYINATNLAKVRIAEGIIRMINVDVEPIEPGSLRAVLGALDEWERMLTKMVDK